MCVPMIYAHWEGFVVNSLKLLIDYLNDLKLSPNDVPTKLVVLGLSEKYGYLSGKQSIQQKIDFTDKFKELFQNVLKFKKGVDTKSNLNGKVLEELCVIFGFNFTSFKEVISSCSGQLILATVLEAWYLTSDSFGAKPAL